MLGRIASSSIGRDTSRVAFGQALFKGSLYLGSIALSRSLSHDEFAAWGYFLVTSTFLSIFFTGGLTLAATKAFADAAAHPDHHDKTAAVLLLAIGAAIAAVAASPLYLPVIADEAVRLDDSWLLAGGAAQAVYTVALGAMFGASAFRQLLVPLLIGSGALLAGAAASALTGALAPSLVGYVVSFVAPALIYGLWLQRRGHLTLVRPSRGALANVTLTALPTLGLGIITFGVSWLVTRVLLEHAVSTAEFNQFVIGMQWFVLALFLPNSLGNALFPRFILGARTGRIDVRLATRVTAWVFIIIALVASVAALFTPALSWLYDYEFDRAFVFTILIAAALAGAGTMIGYPVIAAFGVSIWMSVNIVLLGVCGVLLMLFPPVDALGAAMLICTSYSAVLAAAIIALAQVSRLRVGGG